LQLRQLYVNNNLKNKIKNLLVISNHDPKSWEEEQTAEYSMTDGIEEIVGLFKKI